MNDAEVTQAVDSMIALAFKEAEDKKAAEEAERERRLAEAEAELGALHVYDPRPYAEAEPDPALYGNNARPLAVKADGTPWGSTEAAAGIGALYGLPGSEWALAELGDWTLGKEPDAV